MKYVLPLCILSAFFISPANCDCTSTCLDSYTSALSGLTTEAQICPIMRSYLRCLEISCNVDLSSYYSFLEKAMKSYGISCDLNGASRSLSFSLLTVCGSVLLTAYRVFNM